MQVEALVDSGATTMFIDKTFVRKNHLVTNRLPKPCPVTNADGTPNKAGFITEYVRAYLDIEGHKSKNVLFVTSLGDKDMMIGYSFLYHHNPEIDFHGNLEFTRCPDTCTNKARKTHIVEAGTEELQLEQELPWDLPLDEVGMEDLENPYINWIEVNDPNDQLQARVMQTMFTDLGKDFLGDRTGLDGVYVYLKGYNLMVWTFDDDLWFNPETSSSDPDYLGLEQMGLYNMTQPNLRQFMFGVRLDF